MLNYKKAWKTMNYYLGKGHVHYIKMFLEGEIDELDLELGLNVGGSESP